MDLRLLLRFIRRELGQPWHPPPKPHLLERDGRDRPVEIAIESLDRIESPHLGCRSLGNRTKPGRENSKQVIPLALEQPFLQPFLPPFLQPFLPPFPPAFSKAFLSSLLPHLVGPRELHLSHLPVSFLRYQPLEAPPILPAQPEVRLDEVR